MQGSRSLYGGRNSKRHFGTRHLSWLLRHRDSRRGSKHALLKCVQKLPEFRNWRAGVELWVQAGGGTPQALHDQQWPPHSLHCVMSLGLLQRRLGFIWKVMVGHWWFGSHTQSWTLNWESIPTREDRFLLSDFEGGKEAKDGAIGRLINNPITRITNRRVKYLTFNLLPKNISQILPSERRIY